MINKDLIKKAFIADLCHHPLAPSVRYQLSSVAPNQDVDTLFKSIESEITVSDILNAQEDGVAFIDHAEGWKNFPKLAELVAKNGTPITAADLLGRIPGKQNKTFLQSATDNNGGEYLFTPSVWKGRFVEAETLFYKIPYTKRNEIENRIPFQEFKRGVYALDGLRTREDTLADLNIDWRDFPTMFEHGGIVRLRSIVAKLESHGLHLTKEDVMFPDREGDTMFFRKGVWAHFDEIVSVLAKNGEKFEVDDFFKQYGVRSHILKEAQTKGEMEKIFTPVLWDGRINEMLELWGRLAPLEKQDMGLDKFADVVANAEDRMYGGLITVDKNLKLQDLRQPIAIEGKVHVYPLGLKSVWSDWDKIQNVLNENGEHMKVSMLRRKSGYRERSILEMAVKNGHLEKVVNMLVETKQGLQIEDLMQRDHNNINLLMTIARRKELKTLFTPDLWVGRMNDMKTLWGQIPVEYKAQVNWSQVLNQVNVSTLNSSPKQRPALKRKR